MSQKDWAAVDAYLADRLLIPDALLESVLRANADSGLPAIDVSPLQGQFLLLLARIAGAARILEIGTLGGYSTIWLARALPGKGRLISMEIDPGHADVARSNIEAAGFSDRVVVLTGSAAVMLPKLLRENIGPFDLIFIDADKASLPEYLDWSLKLSRPGTVIVADNVVREGAVVNRTDSSPDVQGVRHFMDYIHQSPRLTATALQTVGVKGWDGFAVAVVD